MLGCARDVRPPAGCPGLTPGCPAPLFPALFSALLFKWLARPDVRPLAQMSGLPVHLHYNGHIRAHAMPLFPTGEG